MKVDFERFKRFNLPEIQARAGWHPLIFSLLENIDNLIGPKRAIAVDQIKEKFGSLRFYWRSDLPASDVDAIQKLIADAEHASTITCEICGKPGIIEAWNGGFYQANCVEHARVSFQSRRKGSAGSGWKLDMKAWKIIDPATGQNLPAARMSEMYGEARATLDAHRKKILGGVDGKNAEIFGAQMPPIEAAREANEFILARYVCRSPDAAATSPTASSASS
jgi:hypothetical protein